ncbi:MAG TPA: hypothetical protein VGS22_19295 [Thermoanaerobaculia bacterium]|nr:hypothetical protein [Thermoanaerobaculia bacterium]
MDTRNENNRLGTSIAHTSKRARLDALLFGGAKVGTTLLSPAVIVEPKYPVAVGE